MRIVLCLTLCSVYIVTGNPVFDKYIILKRSLNRASLPVHEIIPPPPPPPQHGLDHDTGKTESDMRASMLAKPSLHSGNNHNNKYAVGHTFIPTVHSKHTPPANTNHTVKQPVQQPQPRREGHVRVQRQDHERHSQEVIEALVGQGGRTGASHHIATTTKSVWWGWKPIRVLVFAVFVWVCVVVLRRTATKRKPRSVKKRLTKLRLVA